MKKRFERRAKLFKLFGMLFLGLIGVLFFSASPEAGVGMLTAIAAVPIWGSIKENTFKELTADEFKELDAEKQIDYINDLNVFKANKLAKMEEDLKKSNSDEIKTAISELKAEMNKDNKEQLKILQKAIETQGEALKTLMNEKGAKEVAKTIGAVVKENLSELKKLQSKEVKKITIKVTRADITDHTLALRLDGVGQVATRATKIKPLFNQANVDPGQGGVVRYVDQSEADITRAAAAKAEGVAAPTSAIKWVEYTMALQEIKDSIPVTKRSLIDVGFMENEIRNFLLKNMDLKVDSDLWNANGTAPNIKGIYTYADAFVNPGAGAGTITAATEYDLINEAVKQVEAATSYICNYALISPTDYNTMISQKDANNNYIMPPFARMEGGKLFVGDVEIIKSSAVTANTMLLGDFTYATLYQGDDLTIEIGEVDTQFVKGEVTMLATEQLGLLVRSVNTDAFIKVADMAASIAAITA